MNARLHMLVALFLTAGVSALGQNLNPTVEVTNIYQREASGIEKPGQLLSLPDSLFKFNYNFDYSVKTQPYMGSYEFEPYKVELRPMARPDGQSTLYLRGGVGYGFHPELTAIWTPIKAEHFRMNVYGDHYSYVGKYRHIGLENNYFKGDGTFYGGCEARSQAGVNVLWDWIGGHLQADLHYKNILASDQYLEGTQAYHSAGATVSARSNPYSTFLWDGTVKADWLFSPAASKEWALSGQFSGGTRVDNHIFTLDLGADAVLRGDYALLFTVKPRYRLLLDRLKVDAGVKFSYMYEPNPDFYTKQSDFIFPDVYVSYELVPEAVYLQTSVTGGDRLDSWQSLLEKNSFLASFSGRPDLSVERVNAMVGARGQLLGRFHYDIKGGYALRKHDLLWGYSLSYDFQRHAPLFDYVSYHLFYVDAALGWSSEYLDVDGSLIWRKTSQVETFFFAPPAWEGKLRALYNWGGRWWAGVDLEGQTERGDEAASLPGFIDLGLYGELRINRELGLWLRLGNILNQEVQRTPFHAERGIYGTIGARWNF